MGFQVINPSNSQSLAAYQYFKDGDVEKILTEVSLSQKSFRAWTHAERSAALRLWAKNLEQIKHQIARQISIEMGKPIVQAVAEITKTIRTMNVIADKSVEWLQEVNINFEQSKNTILIEPLGLVLAIMPWNFPIWQTMRCAAMALIVGNGVLLKPAEQTVESAILLEKSLPESLKKFFKVLIVDHAQIKNLIARHEISAVSLTGSTLAGQKIAAQAGACLKKTVLELGGSDAALVFPDLDSDNPKSLKHELLLQGVQKCVQGRMQNAGQSCIALKRFIVHEEIFQNFLDFSREELKNFHPGDPLSEKAMLGPLVNEAAKNKFLNQIKMANNLGFHVEKIFHQDFVHCFVSPYLIYHFGRLTSSMRKWLRSEEVFGPAPVLISFSSESEAIELANDSDYGLGASVFTQSDEVFQRVSRQLQVGMVAHNEFLRSDVMLPFGGVKQSGYGRELSYWGLLEFANLKLVSTKATT